MAFGGQKPKVSDTGDQKLWDLPDPIAEDLARYQKGERLDIPRLLTVAKEIGKSLAIFRPPQGYEPEPIAPELSITPDMARLLGAPSLAEYFRRTLLSQDPHRDLSSRGQCPLPRGPESIPKALRAVEEAILGYRSVDSQAYKKILGELSAIRASLLRAQSLSVELFSLAELFRVESLALRHEAQKLVKAGRKLAIAPEPDDLDSGLRQDAPPLTELTQNLTKTLVDTRSVLLAQKRWRLEIRQVIEEMDSFKAAHLTSKLPIDPVRLKTFDARLMDLENASEVLAAKRQATDERLTRALANLESHESQLVGEANTTVLSYVQTLASSVDTLLKTILARRFDLAEAAWRLPRLVGRPIFLENVYSQTAIFLAQSQGLLEELKSRLNRQVARLSSSREAREAARAALAMDKDKAYPSLAREAQRRLSQLKALRKKELAERAPKTAKAPDKDIRDKTHATHDETYDKPFDWPSDIAKDWPSDAPSDFSAPLTESPPPQVASPAIEYLAEQLNAVALERDRLKDELSSLTERLTESGQTKAKLMKMVESARRELKNSGQEIASLRQQVNDNQEGLRQATLEKEELSKLYDQTIKDYNNLTSAANQRNEEFQNIWADRELLAKKRADLEISLANLDHEKRALEAKGQELAISLDQARGQETALATELAGHQEELAEATRARQRLGQVITAYRGQLDRLAMANQALRQAWLGRGQALKRGEKEKVGHKALLARREKAIIRQVARRRELLDELSQFRARLESMEAERTRLNQEIEAARAEAERARNETLQLEAESQEFRKEAEERLAQSQELRKEAEELLAENQEFRKTAEERLAESQEFRKKAEARLAQAQSEALAKEERLKKELGDLQKEMDQSLKPLIELLGLALWQGEAQARQASQTAANNVIKLQKEAAAREAGLRVRGAGREIDLLERLARREKDLEALKAEIENMEMEKTASLEAGQNQTQSWVVNQLSVALAASDLRHEHLNRGLRDLKARFSSQRSEAQSVKTEMEELIQNQAQALARHQAWLSELVPLVAFFLDSGLDFWTHSPATGDTRQAVLFFLRQENAALTEELANVRSERQGLIAERQSLLVNQEGIKDRLTDLARLVGFLLRQFLENVSSLAQAWNQRDLLLSQIAALHAAQTGSAYVTPSEGRVELAQSQERLSWLAKENEVLQSQVDRATTELDRQRDEGASLRQAKKEVETLLAKAEKELARLTALEKSLAETKTESNRLTIDNRRLMSTADRQAEELAKLKEELALLDAAPRSNGQLEAVWGALNYLKARSLDSLEALKTRLDQEVRRGEDLQLQLAKKEENIKTLENRQDSLSILFWTVAQMAAEGQLSFPQGLIEALPSPEEPLKPEEPEGSEGEEGEDEDDDEPDKAPKTSFGKGLLAEIRKAARKSLFGLMITGGLVMHFPAPGEAKPILLGTPETPMIELNRGAQSASQPLRPANFVQLEAMDNFILAKKSLAPGAQSQGLSGDAQSEPAARSIIQCFPGPSLDSRYAPIVYKDPGLRPLGHFSGEERWESSAAANDLALATRYPCRALGRVIDLGLLRLEGVLADGHSDVEAEAMEFFDAQARKWGLSTVVLIRLIRAAYDKDKTVFLTELSGEEAVLNLSRPHLPNMTRALRSSSFKEVLGRYLLPRLDRLPKFLADFWDRLFLDFFQKTQDLQEASLGLAWHLAKRLDSPLDLEFGGRLVTPKEIKNLPLEDSHKLLTGYILESWPEIRGRHPKSPDYQKASRVAADILALGRIMGAPWTFIAILVHRDRELGAPWPSTLELYGWARDIAEVMLMSSIRGAPNNPALCDLDSMASFWSVERDHALGEKMKRLTSYFSREIHQADNLFNGA